MVGEVGVEFIGRLTILAGGLRVEVDEDRSIEASLSLASSMMVMSTPGGSASGAGSILRSVAGDSSPCGR
jgi:hypothetical protein